VKVTERLDIWLNGELRSARVQNTERLEHAHSDRDVRLVWRTGHQAFEDQGWSDTVATGVELHVNLGCVCNKLILSCKHEKKEKKHAPNISTTVISYTSSTVGGPGCGVSLGRAGISCSTQ
jgi:hypothetical protein